MKIGVVGLGSMGSGVTKNLLKAGLSVNVYDALSDRVKEQTEYGAIHTAHYAQLAQQSDVILTFLPMSPFDSTLENVILGEEGLLNHMNPQSILIECGNT